MARFVFFTWEGGGNQPPALGLAQALRSRGHEILFAGYTDQRALITGRGFAFRPLEQSQAAWRTRAAAHLWSRLLEAVLVCPAQGEEVRQVVADEPGAVLVVDCMMFAALAAAERARVPTAVLVHSAPGALLHPGSILAQEVVLAPLNALRIRAELPPLGRVRDAWLPFPTLCATIPQMDPFAAEAPISFDYVGPIFDRLPRSDWRSPWPPDDPRPRIGNGKFLGGKTGAGARGPTIRLPDRRIVRQAPRVRQIARGGPGCRRDRPETPGTGASVCTSGKHRTRDRRPADARMPRHRRETGLPNTMAGCLGAQSESDRFLPEMGL